MLRGTGLDEGALGVDAENPSGALRLYESLGFRRHRTGIALPQAALTRRSVRAAPIRDHRPSGRRLAAVGTIGSCPA